MMTVVEEPCCPPSAAPASAPAVAHGAASEGRALDDAAADEALAAYAKALGHPARVRIIRTLIERGARVCGEIVYELPLAQSTVSQHLKVLREAGLVRGEVDGPRTCYCVDPAALRHLRVLIGAL